MAGIYMMYMYRYSDSNVALHPAPTALRLGNYSLAVTHVATWKVTRFRPDLKGGAFCRAAFSCPDLYGNQPTAAVQPLRI
jgi:hypothetical protein